MGAVVRKLVTVFIGYLLVSFVMIAIIKTGIDASAGEGDVFREAAYLWSVALLDLLLVCASFGIYKDAAKHKIGSVRGAKGLLNMSGAAIAAFALLAAPLVIPLYLFNRQDLIAQAKEQPFENKGLWLYLLVAVAYVLISPLLFGFMIAGH